jgi:hypothetical protein
MSGPVEHDTDRTVFVAAAVNALVDDHGLAGER